MLDWHGKELWTKFWLKGTFTAPNQSENDKIIAENLSERIFFMRKVESLKSGI